MWDLQKALEEEEAPTYSSLHPVFKGDSPIKVSNRVKYDKGCLFLYYIEELIGIEAMGNFLRYYIRTNYM